MHKIIDFTKTKSLLESDIFEIKISLEEHIVELLNCNFKSSNGDIIYAGISENNNLVYI